MPTNKERQRREATRQLLQRQLERRRENEARRRKVTLITSVAVTVVLLAGVGIAVAVLTSGGGSNGASGCAAPGGSVVHFRGVTVRQATNLKAAPVVSSSVSAAPSQLQCQDLVVGTGRAATPTSKVSVQYVGALYRNGSVFDSSWSRGGAPVQFSLSGVVPGFTQGIGGHGKIAGMKVGGRRLIIMPAALGYGSQGNAKIPANSPLVFVVDLTKVG